MRVAAFLLLLVPAVAAAAEPVDFKKQVYPILRDHCFRCHQGDDAKRGVRLDTRDDVLLVVKPGKSAQSRLVVSVSGAEPAMPRRGEPLTAAQVQALRD